MQTRTILVAAPVWASQMSWLSSDSLPRVHANDCWRGRELSARLAAQAHPKLI
jgi:hypothetical protein